MENKKIREGRYERFNTWKRWVLENNMYPRLYSYDEYERKLAVMISTLINTIKNDPTYIDIFQEYYSLKKQFPYADNIRRKRDNKTNLEEIIKWSKEHKRLPNQKSNDEVERRLSYRCHQLISGLRKKPYLNKKILEEYEELKEYLKSIKGV